MNEFPEEYDLLSLFESEPTFLDTPSNNFLFYYNEATYQFSNGEEDFIVKLCPSYGDVSIQVNQRISRRLISHLDFKRINKFEITADKKDTSSILLTILDEDFKQIIEIDFKPIFKLIFSEECIR
ncbi:hypothetical protein [Bacillus testis]|uniref:hypothetical protein n=1 Tax=Bacillus testis TaxID=1622072 RepID=UPI00067EA8ED|nr:hypothetical protein [Bacillus testis]